MLLSVLSLMTQIYNSWGCSRTVPTEWPSGYRFAIEQSDTEATVTNCLTQVKDGSMVRCMRVQIYIVLRVYEVNAVNFVDKRRNSTRSKVHIVFGHIDLVFVMKEGVNEQLEVVTPPVTPPTPPTPPQCQCAMDLYSDSLCPPNGPCNRDPAAVTYGPPPLCPVTINCEQTDYIRIQYADGAYINNIRMRDFRQLSDIQCVNGEWRYYGQAAFDKVLRHIVCYSVAIIEPPHLRKTREVGTQISCGTCSSFKNSTDIDLCPSEKKCSAPILKTLKDTYGCEGLAVGCPNSSLVLQLKSGSSMIVHPQDVYCNEIWIYDDSKQSYEVQSMLCVSKELPEEKYSRCSDSCPSLKRICPACYEFDDKLSSTCTSSLDCGKAGNVAVLKSSEGALQTRFQAHVENNALLFCVNGTWILNINDTKVKVMDDEHISCKSLNISSHLNS